MSAASWSEKFAVQCLYCDADLKTFRGFFDEDFCSRDHREKYSSSFRKALTSFGGLEAAAENAASRNTASAPPVPCAPAAGPRIAGFQPVAVPPRIAEAERYGYHPELVALCHEVEIPSHGIAWSVALDFEERLADPVAASAGTFAVVEPAPALLHVSSPLVTPEFGVSETASSLEAAGPALSGEDSGIPGYRTPWTFAESAPMAPVELLMPWLAESAGAHAPAPAAEDDYAQVTMLNEGIQSTPTLTAEIPLVHETQLPEFTPAREILLGDDLEQSNWSQLPSDPRPAGREFGYSVSGARELAWRSVPVDRPISTQNHAPVMMPPSLELASARSASIPDLSPAVESGPQAARQLAADFVDDAVGTSAVPRSHEPLKLTFGNLVKIKNWRLRITFAKPA